LIELIQALWFFSSFSENNSSQCPLDRHGFFGSLWLAPTLFGLDLAESVRSSGMQRQGLSLSLGTLLLISSPELFSPEDYNRRLDFGQGTQPDDKVQSKVVCSRLQV
jgi:hypothetical protein